MKFPSTSGDIVIVHVDQKVARECYIASLKFESNNRLCYGESLRGQLRECRRGRSPKSRGLTRGRSWETRSPIRKHIVALVNLDP